MREDAIRLYGFLTAAERDWFRILQSVQGVGAKVALGILGALTADALWTAIAREDKAMMARAPGVGPKLAARLVLELKDKAPALGASISAARTRRGEGRPECRRRRRTRSLPWSASAMAARRRPRRSPSASDAGARGGDGGLHPSGLAGTGAVRGEIAPRGFFLPALGLVLLFAALGPPIGAGLFVPLAVVLRPPAGADALDAAGLRRRPGRPHRRADRGLCHRHRAGRGDRLRLRALGRGRAGAGAARARRGVHRRPHHLWRRAQAIFARRAARADDPRPCRSSITDWTDATSRAGSTPRSGRPSSPAAPSPPSSARFREPPRPDDAAGRSARGSRGSTRGGA